MELKSEISYNKNSRCSDVYAESRTDYSLPDYLGEVRKILFSSAALRPSGRFSGGDDVEFSGVVVYNIVYLDMENKLCSAEFTSDYDYSVKCSADKYRDSVSDTRISAYSIRLCGPRKLSARASLVGSVRLYETASISIGGNAIEDSPEVCTKRINVHDSAMSAVVEREYAEEIAMLDGAIADDIDVVYCSAEPVVDSIEWDGDIINVKGKLRMWAVIQNGDAPAYRQEKVISIDESITGEGLDSDMKLTGELTVVSLKNSVNATENGCDVVISSIIEIGVIGECNRTVDVVTDAYLRNCKTDNSYASIDYVKFADLVSVRGNHNAELDRSELESDGINEVLFLDAVARIDRIDREENSATVVGEIRYSGVASEILDDKISYVGIKFFSPIAINVNTSCHIDEKTQLEAKILTSGVSVSLDANKIYAACCTDCILNVCQPMSQVVLSSSVKNESEECEAIGAKISVYYPTEGDTLFSVAKRYRTSTFKLLSDNDIADAVFSSDKDSGDLVGIKKLLIY